MIYLIQFNVVLLLTTLITFLYFRKTGALWWWKEYHLMPLAVICLLSISVFVSAKALLWLVALAVNHYIISVAMAIFFLLQYLADRKIKKITKNIKGGGK